MSQNLDVMAQQIMEESLELNKNLKNFTNETIGPLFRKEFEKKTYSQLLVLRDLNTKLNTIRNELDVSCQVIDATIPETKSNNFTVGYGIGTAAHALVSGKNGWVKYNFFLDTASSVLIAIKYNSKDTRPLQLKLNDTCVCNNLAEETTDTYWDTRNLRWDEVGPFDLPMGNSIIELTTNGYFPHLKQIRITKLSPTMLEIIDK